MSISSILSPSTDPSRLSGSHSADTPEKIHKAASQFESILIGQILKTAQGGSGEGWLGDSEDQAAGSTMDLATEFLANALASKGGLGLTKMISSSLERASNSSGAGPSQPLPGTPPID